MNRYQIKITFISIAFICMAQHGLSQKMLISQQMQEDFQVFKNSIQDIHPGLYWYGDSSEVADRFNGIEESITTDLSIQSFYGLLQEFYAGINCGHSWMQRPKAWTNQLDSGNYRLPFDLYFEDSVFTIMNDLTADQEVEIGAQILAMNGVSMLEIVNNLKRYTISDGFNQTRRFNFVATNFYHLYQLHYGLADSFELEIYSPNLKQKVTKTFQGLTKAGYESVKIERYGAEPNRWSQPLAQFSISEGIGYLDINTFAKGWLKSRDIKYKKFLKNSFAQMKEQGVKKLILDIRGNGGGDDYLGAMLCQYLINEEFGYFDRMETVTSKFNYKDYSNTKWMNWIGVILKKDKKKPGYFTFNYHRGLRTQKPNDLTFNGELVVLVDGQTFSTAADVASILYENGRGTFVGREVGGGYYGNNSAMQYDITLPNSKITYYIPIVRYYSSVDKPELYGHGVKPDIVVKKTYEDYMSKRDAGLEKAKSLLNN
ncbi:hypothetical protein BFP97_07410 [Roseivirga sp. 4D4]|uniref:S41 family peptidase n=1 Tax=Roseivirga sp. 4D4 TaxID=1889784 RepID=UPI000852FB5C|nr:S41 family peptidase [Roseivirga sp. 4D4]OEK01352.1 hypothetical protein BFP97_07410 [Roseivirga sp. 4D4]